MHQLNKLLTQHLYSVDDGFCERPSFSVLTEIANNLNKLAYFEDDGIEPFQVSEFNHGTIVSCLGEVVWSTENGCGRHVIDEDIDMYERFDTFLIRMFKRHVSRLNKVKRQLMKSEKDK